MRSRLPLALLPIDPYRYDHAKGCRQHPMPGALALVRWPERSARGEFWGIMCCSKPERGNPSLHAEGRAIDWHVDVARPADRREARRPIGLLLATDRAGLDSRGGPIERVDKTLAHRDHIHLGLSLAEARGRTSFWGRAGS